jgi:thiamine biosynthesis lipoprotein
MWLVQLSIGADESDGEARSALEDVFSELSRIDSLMSEWKEDSPVSSINTAAGAEQVPVPEELRSLIERALVFGEATEGAFDITWKGLAHLWSFDDSFEVPSENAIQAALSLVNFRMVKIDGNRVGLSRAGMALGLGGIAKGYAIDRAAFVLRHRGFRDFLVNGGGDVLTAGTRAGQPWRVGVRSPRGKENELVARLNLSGGAVVTSGDYERFKIVDGVRYHHIIDPRTGRPAKSSRSVTIVAPGAEEADVLATAVFVLGPGKGLDLVSQRSDTEAFVIDASGKFWMTAGFRQLAEFY